MAEAVINTYGLDAWIEVMREAYMESLGSKIQYNPALSVVEVDHCANGDCSPGGDGKKWDFNHVRYEDINLLGLQSLFSDTTTQMDDAEFCSKLIDYTACSRVESDPQCQFFIKSCSTMNQMRTKLPSVYEEIRTAASKETDSEIESLVERLTRHALKASEPSEAREKGKCDLPKSILKVLRKIEGGFIENVLQGLTLEKLGITATGLRKGSAAQKLVERFGEEHALSAFLTTLASKDLTAVGGQVRMGAKVLRVVIKTVLTHACDNPESEFARIVKFVMNSGVFKGISSAEQYFDENNTVIKTIKMVTGSSMSIDTMLSLGGMVGYGGLGGNPIDMLADALGVPKPKKTYGTKNKKQTGKPSDEKERPSRLDKRKSTSTTTRRSTSSTTKRKTTTTTLAAWMRKSQDNLEKQARDEL